MSKTSTDEVFVNILRDVGVLVDRETSRTNYIPMREPRRLFGVHCNDLQFVEEAFLKNNERGREVLPLTRVFPFLTTLYGATSNRVAFGRRPLTTAAGETTRYEAPALARAGGTALASRS